MVIKLDRSPCLSVPTKVLEPSVEELQSVVRIALITFSRQVDGGRAARAATTVGDLLIAPRLHLVADLIGLGGDDRAEAAARFAARETACGRAD